MSRGPGGNHTAIFMVKTAWAAIKNEKALSELAPVHTTSGPIRASPQCAAVLHYSFSRRIRSCQHPPAKFIDSIFAFCEM
jgi:hypothetical protein